MNENEFDRTARAWLADGPTRMADRAVLSALEDIHTTRQRRAWWPAWRSNRMNTYVKVIAAAAAVLLVAVVGYQLLPRNGGVGGQPTTAPSPSPTLLASGTFRAKGAPVDLNATGAGDSVTGTMTVSGDTGETLFAVDLECTRTAEDGRILIAGDTTEATGFATKGTYTAIVLKPGSPVRAVFGFGEDAPSADSCMAYLDGIIDQTFTTAIGDGALEPIEGTVQLGP